MVSIKNLLLLGCAALSAVAAPVDSTATLQQVQARDVAPVVATKLEMRDPTKSHMRIHWSRLGKIVFTIGADFPQSVLQSFNEGGAGPAKVLYHQFRDWINSYHGLDNVPDLLEPLIQNKDNNPVVGGIYGVDPKFLQDFGIGIELRGTNLNANNIQDCVKALYAWATAGGSAVEILESPLVDQLSLGLMGANRNSKRELEQRERTNQCPTNPPPILNYANKDAPDDNDWTRNFRFSPPCDS